MTVVATIITSAATAHATDSLITQKQPNGKLKQKDWISPKVIRVEAHRGAMSYYGLATRGDDAKLDWSTLKWLTQAANRARPDASGSSVLYARVHLVEENTGLSQDTIGGTDGGFVFPRLPIGFICSFRGCRFTT